eukprot:SAG31_NODE_35_length_31836_cov_10.841352_40_plen_61_part_00
MARQLFMLLDKDGDERLNIEEMVHVPPDRCTTFVPRWHFSCNDFTHAPSADEFRRWSLIE